MTAIVPAYCAIPAQAPTAFRGGRKVLESSPVSPDRDGGRQDLRRRAFASRQQAAGAPPMPALAAHILGTRLPVASPFAQAAAAYAAASQLLTAGSARPVATL
jgi:hypothetical protein